jgi:hypothetical protein
MAVDTIVIPLAVRVGRLGIEPFYRSPWLVRASGTGFRRM